MTPDVRPQDVLPHGAWGEATGRPLVDVAVGEWQDAAVRLRDAGWDVFDLLTAVDEQDAGFDVVLHLWSTAHRGSVLLRTRCPREAPSVPTLAGVFAGAAWHERQVAEMFGVQFAGHPDPGPLLLPDGFSGAPLRKDFVLAARVVRPWPGAPEPGQSSAQAAVGRRKVLPPGVPAPGTWPAGERS